MGLLDKVFTLSRQKPLETKGLLQKTLSILNSNTVKEYSENQGESLYITQDELDKLRIKNKKKSAIKEDLLLKGRSTVKAADVPLTWDKAHKPAPQYHSPTIEKQEVANLYKAVSENIETEQQQDYKKDTESGFLEILKQDISKIEEGIETPAILFSLLKNKLDIVKGAILLYDPLKMVFAPWASCGFDETTMHRLRIPLEFSESFNEMVEGKAIVLDESNRLKPYKPFFSNREFNLLSKLMLSPLVFKGKLLSILIISEANENKDSHALKDILDNISSVFAEKIYSARERKMQLLKKIEPEALDSLEKVIDKHITYSLEKNNNLAILLISVNDFIKQASTATDYLIDPYRINEDVNKILRSLFYGMGSLFELEPGSYIVSIFKIKNPDFDLIFDQTSYILKHFFVSLNKQQAKGLDIKFSYKQYPENGKHSKELLADLI